MIDLALSKRVENLIGMVSKTHILPHFKTLTAGQMRQKTAPWDLVTIADTQAEAAFCEALPRLLPGSRVVGEEGCEADPGLLELLQGHDPVWLVDPVDGTRNFAHRNKRFAVILALVHEGVTRAAWIHNPLRDETVWAILGKGAWIGDRRLRIKPAAGLERLRGSLGNAARKHWISRAEAGRCPFPGKVVRYYCTGLEQADLAFGRLHFALYEKALKPWDHAAGALIVEQAGGYCAIRDSEISYRPTGIIQTKRGLLFAPDPESWRSLHALLP